MIFDAICRGRTVVLVLEMRSSIPENAEAAFLADHLTELNANDSGAQAVRWSTK